jgi:protein involved in polysaccharide export with SLBB domain
MPFNYYLIILLSWGIGVSTINAQVRGSNKTVTSKTDFPLTETEYPTISPEFDRKIVVGDQLSFRIAEDENLGSENSTNGLPSNENSANNYSSKTLIVGDSGNVDVPYIGSIRAVGKRPSELAAIIKKALETKLYRQATVSVTLKRRNERSPGRVYVSGEVKTQGAIELHADQPITVTQAIMAAGGFSDYANQRKVRLVRKSSRSQRPMVIDVKRILNEGQTNLDVTLHAGDMIVVPARFINW